jgi:hypothetical protein
MVALMTFGLLIVKETGTSRSTPNTSSRRIDRRIFAELAVIAEIRPDTRPSDLVITTPCWARRQGRGSLSIQVAPPLIV